MTTKGTGTNLLVETSGKKGGTVIFDGPIPAGNEITLVGDKSDGKFSSNELLFTVDGVAAAVFHVSCSEEIGPGTTDQSGGQHEDPNGALDFTVLEAFSRFNGLGEKGGGLGPAVQSCTVTSGTPNSGDSLCCCQRRGHS